MATLHTRNGSVYLGVGTGVATPLAEIVEFSIDVDFDESVDSAMGDTWETALKGQLKWKGTLSANFDDASTTLFDCATTFSASNVYFYWDRSVTANYYYGTIFPKLGLTASRTDHGKSTASFTGTGQLAKH